MNLTFGFRLAVLGLALFFGAAGAMAQIKPLDNTADPVVAIVNGVPIHRSEIETFQRTLPQQFQQLPLEVLYPALLERAVNMKLIYEAGQKEKLSTDEEVKRRVQQFEERVVQEVYLNRLIEKQVTEEQLRKRYQVFMQMNPAKEEISARHILVQTEVQAKEIIIELGKGADFADLARTKSIDPAGKQQGGDLGYFSREEMVPEFSEAAFKLKDGETSTAPVRSQFGWHVIRVEARRTTSQPFEEVRDKLANDMSQEIMQGVVDRLRRGAKIELFNLDGSPASGAAPARPTQPRR
jgi:peptidyl-prolyl cis-trans isomerase C